LPTEFRIFRAGLNETRKGKFIFDADGARAVMANYAAHDTDGMIDLEHLSLDPESKSYDPDARGWCRLELRNGELWAVGVTWTDDGAARLSQKRQRYISPTFDFDPESRRVIEIHNLALTAMPATDAPQALVAASNRRISMAADGSAEEASAGGLESIAKVLGLGADASLVDLLAKIGELKTAMASDSGADDEDDEEELDDAEMSAAGATPPPPIQPDASDDDKKAVAAASKTAIKVVRLARRTAHRELLTKTGEKSTNAAISKVETWRSAYLAIEADREKLAKERAALEITERRDHVTSWVKLGKEDPATAFDPISKELLEPWASMPLEKIRERSTKLKAGPPAALNAKPPTTKQDPSAPGSTPTTSLSTPLVLDEATKASLARQGIDPELARLKQSDPSAYKETLRRRREGARS
jgi:phage I-like protein